MIGAIQDWVEISDRVAYVNTRRYGIESEPLLADVEVTNGRDFQGPGWYYFLRYLGDPEGTLWYHELIPAEVAYDRGLGSTDYPDGPEFEGWEERTTV